MSSYYCFELGRTSHVFKWLYIFSHDFNNALQARHY